MVSKLGFLLLVVYGLIQWSPPRVSCHVSQWTCFLPQQGFPRRERPALASLSKLLSFRSVHHIAMYCYPKKVSQRCLLHDVVVRPISLLLLIVVWCSTYPARLMASSFGIVPHRTGQASRTRSVPAVLLDSLGADHYQREVEL